MNFNIGAKIKAMRLAASMTQEQLANKLGGFGTGRLKMGVRNEYA